MNDKLRLGIPKGSLQESTFALFKRAGWDFRMSSGRSYHPSCDDAELEPLLLRPQEIPRYVEQGILDAGLTGKDWVEDNGSDVREVCELAYSKATRNPIRVVLAAPNDSDIHSVKDLQGKRIATEYVRLAERYLEKHGVQAGVEFSWGACEVKVPELADAIIVNTETGSSLRAHNLKIVEVLTISTTRLVANHSAWNADWKRHKLEDMALLLTGALHAEKVVGLKMNVVSEKLAEIQNLIRLSDASRNPTISPLSSGGGFALEVIVEEKTVRDLMPKLKRAGAEGIFEYPLNKVVY